MSQVDVYISNEADNGDRVVSVVPSVGPFLDLEVRASDLARTYDESKVLNHRIVMSMFQIALGEGPSKLAVLDSVTVSYLYTHPDASMSRVADLNV